MNSAKTGIINFNNDILIFKKENIYTLQPYDEEWNALALKLMHTKSKKKRNQLKKRYPWYSSTSIPMVIKRINPKLTPIINEILNQNMEISPFDSIEKYYADQKTLYKYVFENLTPDQMLDVNTYMKWFAESLLAKGITIGATRKSIHQSIMITIEASTNKIKWANLMATNAILWWD